MTGFVRRIHEFTISEGIELSAAVKARYPECITWDAQDWVQWAEEGIVDFLFPMNYTNSVRLAAMGTVSHVAFLNGKVPLWEGLGKTSRGSTLSPAALAEQVQAVLRVGADGAVIFNFLGLTDEDLRLLRQLQ